MEVENKVTERGQDWLIPQRWVKAEDLNSDPASQTQKNIFPGAVHWEWNIISDCANTSQKLAVSSGLWVVHTEL